ncbi:metallophosphoesterase [Candidatus Babeliales bacterium]|nr:metallophosphoesterase [Candidatus Babeliales bacterium]
MTSPNKVGDSEIVLKFATFGHIKNDYRRDLPPDHKGYTRSGLNKVISDEIDGQAYFDDKFIKALPKIKEKQTDMLFITGDLMPLNTIDIYERNDSVRSVVNEQKILEHCWKMIISELKDITNDFFIAPGNHDIYGKTAEDVYRNEIGEPYFSFAKKNIRFVILNSVLKDTTNVYYDKWAWPVDLPQEQIQFLENGFKSLWKEEIIFIFIHHSPINIPNWMDKIHPLLAESNCHTVFSGTRFGTMGSTRKDGVIYLDGGIDHNVSYNPSFYVSTEVWSNGKINHDIHYISPTSINGKIRVITNTFGFFIKKTYKFAKKHMLISIFFLCFLSIVFFILFRKFYLNRRGVL